MSTERVFSGMQPTHTLHLGNYLGALMHWVGLQRSHECIYCVADLHAVTVFQDPEALAQQTREVAAAYLASGIDPERSIVFVQSQVPGHAELAWLFNCVARMGWLSRMTQFKEKAGADRANASAGLFVYPALMAADILLYKATKVPVGEDQTQHLELARDIAQKFDRDYAARIAALGFGDSFFPLPEPLLVGPATRVMSLRDGTRKMSKSDPSDYSRINLTDDADAIAAKLRKARTDSLPLPSDVGGLRERPEAANLVGIYAALAGTTQEEVLRGHGGTMFSVFKSALTERVVDALAPIGAEMRRLLADPGHVERVLAAGRERAQAIAAPVLRDAKAIVGLLQPLG